MGGNGHVWTGDLGVSNAGGNDLGGISSQLLRMDVDGNIGLIHNKLCLMEQSLHGGLILLDKIPEKGRKV